MKKEKVDKGFEIFYNNLSYRRKFIRTLWMIPWTILALLFFYVVGLSMIAILSYAVVFVVIGYKQASYNYKKWKEEELENK